MGVVSGGTGELLHVPCQEVISCAVRAPRCEAGGQGLLGLQVLYSLAQFIRIASMNHHAGIGWRKLVWNGLATAWHLWGLITLALLVSELITIQAYTSPFY
jgi:hypothetical protein